MNLILTDFITLRAAAERLSSPAGERRSVAEPVASPVQRLVVPVFGCLAMYAMGCPSLRLHSIWSKHEADIYILKIGLCRDVITAMFIEGHVSGSFRVKSNTSGERMDFGHAMNHI